MDFLGNLFKKTGLVCPLFGLVFLDNSWKVTPKVTL